MNYFLRTGRTLRVGLTVRPFADLGDDPSCGPRTSARDCAGGAPAAAGMPSSDAPRQGVTPEDETVATAEKRDSTVQKTSLGIAAISGRCATIIA